MVDLDTQPEWEILGEFMGTEPTGRRRTMLNVRCGCGEETAARKVHVLGGNSHECSKCAQQRRRLKVRKSTLIGFLTRQFYNRIRAGANRRKLDFEVSQQYLWDLFVVQEGQCALTGLDINLSTRITQAGNADYSAFNASLDRIDSSVGYVEGNVQWVRRDVNYMKRSLTDEEFIQTCRAVVAHADNKSGTK